jgi:hypothetical protein
MTVFRVTPSLAEESASLVFTRELSDNESYRFHAKPIDNWNPITLKWDSNGQAQESSLVHNDVVLIIGAGVDMAVNQKVKDCLFSLLSDYVQFLPVNVVGENEQWYLINITKVIHSAINQEQSKFRTLSNGQKGMLVKAVFNSKEIPRDIVFTFPENTRRFMSSGAMLANAVRDHNITGLEFHECQVDVAEAS